MGASKLSANSGINDLSVSNAAYFSLDGSGTGLALSKGTTGNTYDYQGSHWQDRELGNGLGVMNPTIGTLTLFRAKKGGKPCQTASLPRRGKLASNLVIFRG